MGCKTLTQSTVLRQSSPCGVRGCYLLTDNSIRYLFQVIGGLLDLEQMQDDYERLVTDLLEWIHTKIGELNDRSFSNSVVGIRRDMAMFTNYRLQEKPPKYVTHPHQFTYTSQNRTLVRFGPSAFPSSQPFRLPSLACTHAPRKPRRPSRSSPLCLCLPCVTFRPPKPRPCSHIATVLF